ncbi:MAG: phosphate ABC transporter substrate-binding protein PstS, partial [Terriglobales bacterium]
RWIADFRPQQPKLDINYQSIGSGGGIQQVRVGTVNFGASDAALTDQELATMPPVVQIAESAGPVCVTYNLAGLHQPLRLTGPALAKIFLGQITQWNDPAIARANPGARLPAEPIVVVHRSEGSGTTNIFTTYLSAVSAAWARQVGHGLAVRWLAGLGAKGSEGVTGMVEQTPGAIGYTELNYATANQLPVAAIRNPLGQWVLPSTASASADLRAGAAKLTKDIRLPVVNARGKNAYPITGLTFLILPKIARVPAQRRALLQFLDWALTDGQTTAAGLQYAPLPRALVAADMHLLAPLRPPAGRLRQPRRPR